MIFEVYIFQIDERSTPRRRLWEVLEEGPSGFCFQFLEEIQKPDPRKTAHEGRVLVHLKYGDTVAGAHRDSVLGLNANQFMLG